VTRVGDTCDVIVIGAGPAGSAAAQLLSAWGWSVVLIHRRHTSPALAESLPPSIRKLLGTLGQLDPVVSAGFYPNTGNIADWAGHSRIANSPDAGFHVSRPRFDAVLRGSAAAAGARIVDGIVRRIDGADPTCVTYAAADGAATACHARYVLDCSGRAGVVACRGLRRRDTPYHTLAIVAEWECADWGPDERTCTTVESYRDGWTWSVPLDATRRQCAVMIDKKDSRSLAAIYGGELAKAARLGERLASARRVTAPWACDASVYDAVRAADGHLMLVGDAASFIEPLSSAGVKKALLSAWRAAVVTNTCLRNPAMAGAAVDLYVRRERDVYADCVRRSHAFFAEAAAAYNTPFWNARADLAEVGALGNADGNTETDEARDADVRAAFEQLRGAARLRLRPASYLRFEPAAAIEGREVVMRDAIAMPGLDAPLQFAAGVNLAALARLACEVDQVPALIAAYRAQVAPVPVDGLLTGLSLLVARRALVAEDQDDGFDIE
jgi:flavin-dependent dehydrogenase